MSCKDEKDWTPAQRGHRSSAMGEPKEANPFPGADYGKGTPFDEWLDAWLAVDAHRQNGLDPAGHLSPRPHLCVRDVTKVCNCCTACATGPAAPRVDWIEILSALPRIATALESIAATVAAGAARDESKPIEFHCLEDAIAHTPEGKKWTVRGQPIEFQLRAPVGFKVVGRSSPERPMVNGDWVRLMRTTDGADLGRDERYQPRRAWYNESDSCPRSVWDAGCYDILEPIGEPPAP